MRSIISKLWLPNLVVFLAGLLGGILIGKSLTPSLDIPKTIEAISKLAWPAIFLTIAIRYQPFLDQLLERVAKESEEIQSSILGLTIKFRKEFSKLVDELPEEKGKTKERLVYKLAELASIQFRLIAQKFFGHPLGERRSAAHDIAQLSKAISLSTLLKFSESPFAGERVGAGIGILAHLDMDPKLAKNEDVVKAVQQGLTDSKSRVRYRYVNLVAKHPEVAESYQDELKRLAVEDDNPTVRKCANNIIF